MSEPTENCITCGSPVKIHSSDEGTSHYEPLMMDELNRLRTENTHLKKQLELVPSLMYGEPPRTVAELLKENAQLRSENKQLHNAYSVEVFLKQKERVKELEEGLEKYGRHYPKCARMGSFAKQGMIPKHECECGLSNLLKGEGDEGR